MFNYINTINKKGIAYVIIIHPGMNVFPTYSCLDILSITTNINLVVAPEINGKWTFLSRFSSQLINPVVYSFCHILPTHSYSCQVVNCCSASCLRKLRHIGNATLLDNPLYLHSCCKRIIKVCGIHPLGTMNVRNDVPIHQVKC